MKIVVKLRVCLGDDLLDIYDGDSGKKIGEARADHGIYQKKTVYDLEGNVIAYTKQVTETHWDARWSYDLYYHDQKIAHLKEKEHFFRREYFVTPQNLHIISKALDSDLHVFWGKEKVMEIWHTSEMYENSSYCRVKCTVYKYPEDRPLAMLIAVALCH